MHLEIIIVTKGQPNTMFAHHYTCSDILVFVQAKSLIGQKVTIYASTALNTFTTCQIMDSLSLCNYTYTIKWSWNLTFVLDDLSSL